MRPNVALAVLRDLWTPAKWIQKISGESILLPVTVEALDSHKGQVTNALLDCGATGCYINQDFALRNNLFLEHLCRPVPVYNADGTANKNGKIEYTTKLQLTVDDHTEVTTFAVTNTGANDIIIRFNWLKHHNSSIDWKKGTIKFDRCPGDCKRKKQWKLGQEEDEEDIEEGDRIFVVNM
ncbi:hypothetical protein D9758_015743 [Tetrapyrgos nigripes]|uniref:Uncharacterized protein n=1 Tax=Tetrapyrgos nigripes TaxID=182062 RepID=A0A8H5CD38_9AGAR|nr:hypothetical protein D9758_015743 [Tetrapyrgos nigripes]